MSKIDPDKAQSLKELFQGMVPDDPAVVVGVVIGVNPLQIQIQNDEKNIVSGSCLQVCRDLTDWQTRIDISLDTGKIDSSSHKAGAHGHGFELFDSRGGKVTGIIGTPYEGAADGPKTTTKESGKASSHEHFLKTFIIEGALMTVYNALKEGEAVYLLQYNNGKNYLAIDRAYL